jgi:glycerol uptake facilitator-like aquaporin
VNRRFIKERNRIKKRNRVNLSRKIFSEFLGTAGLLAVVVGSGIMGERLSPGNDAVSLLANSIATGAGLVFLILSFGAISAHFNPAVTLTEVVRGFLSLKILLLYSLAQTTGAISGVVAANLMFDLPAVFVSTKVRTGFSQWLGEFIATFGLIGVIRTGSQFHPRLIAFIVAAYITAAYWFTSSTSFANPAVTIARSLSNTFAGIHPADVFPFIVAQILGALAATVVFNWLLNSEENKDV